MLAIYAGTHFHGPLIELPLSWVLVCVGLLVAFILYVISVGRKK
jgi:hypothetical protein